MTLQTNALEFRLSGLLGRAQKLFAEQLAAGQQSLLDDARPWFDKAEYVDFWRALASCETEFKRVLREIAGIEKQAAHMKGGLSSVPQAERWREQSRIASLENDLDRVYKKAARLAALLMSLRRKGSFVTTGDLLQGINHLTSEAGKTIEQASLMRIVEHVSKGPAFVSGTPQRVGAGSMADMVFVLIALLVMLGRRGKQQSEQ
jgi:hypothetical protein